MKWHLSPVSPFRVFLSPFTLPLPLLWRHIDFFVANKLLLFYMFFDLVILICFRSQAFLDLVSGFSLSLSLSLLLSFSKSFSHFLSLSLSFTLWFFLSFSLSLFLSLSLSFTLSFFYSLTVFLSICNILSLSLQKASLPLDDIIINVLVLKLTKAPDQKAGPVFQGTPATGFWNRMAVTLILNPNQKVNTLSNVFLILD